MCFELDYSDHHTSELGDKRFEQHFEFLLFEFLLFEVYIYYDGIFSFPPTRSCGAATSGRASEGAGPGRGLQPAVWLGVAVMRRCWPPSPCRGAAPCGLRLVAGGVAGAAAGRMPRGRWRPAIGGRPHWRPPRRQSSPVPFSLAYCGGLLVGWVSCRT